MSNNDNEEMEEVSFEELAENNNVLLNALIDLLIEKKIFTEEEFQNKVNPLDNEEE
jgi:hypothetical protein